MAPGNQSAQRSVDLRGLRRRYSRGVGDGVRRLLLLCLGVVVASGVWRLLTADGAWAVVVVLAETVGLCAALVLPLQLPAAVLLRPSGIAFRHRLRTTPTTAWTQVAEIRVQGRWDTHSSVVFRDGRQRELVAMPAGDAERLAEALIDSRS
ncbi:hypothetical protein [Kineococcus sp. SYSU DK003]|uniref:hypothetical protein n=1 Tax=Kineococcus sp. SYSU DK003 TaxID=3383124 RepID=UPI003D7C4AC1